MGKHEELTQKFSSWGDKLLQHTDVLYSIQNKKRFIPITIQISVTEKCDLGCSFCSVSNRPKDRYLASQNFLEILTHFKMLGAKSIEITGGGNPLLYSDPHSHNTINDLIVLAAGFGFDIGIITNSYNLGVLRPDLYKYITWLRISLSSLDFGIETHQFNLAEFPQEKLSFSYVIWNSFKETSEVLCKISKLLSVFPNAKFVRLVGNCLISGNNSFVEKVYKPLVDSLDKSDKFFIKNIGTTDIPFCNGCYVGLIRPYIAPPPNGGSYQVYICNSHVLSGRNYDLKYSLGNIMEIPEIWDKANQRFQSCGYPYFVSGNNGIGWDKTCQHCLYNNNNKLLHSVCHEMPDRNFP